MLAPMQVEGASPAPNAAAKASSSRPESAGTKLMFSVAERALEAGKGPQPSSAYSHCCSSTVQDDVVWGLI